MKRFAARLRFLHTHLWHEDGRYRLAVLFGPAPLLGLALALAAWSGWQEARSWRSAQEAPLPPWAKVDAPPTWQRGSGTVQAVPPDYPLPEADQETRLEPGWRTRIHQVSVDASLSASVAPHPLKGLVMDGLTADLAQIASDGPEDAPFVAIGAGFLVVRQAGTYAVSARFERPAAETAACLVRLGMGGRRIISELEASVSDATTRSFVPVQFELPVGLYRLDWAFGCWHDRRESAQGQLTILLRRPGEAELAPLKRDEVVR